MPAAIGVGASAARARESRSGKKRSVGRDRLHAARALHGFVFGEELQRHGRHRRRRARRGRSRASCTRDRRPHGRRRHRSAASSSRASCRSISSVYTTTASIPTIWIAPAAWWTCARACLSGAVSAGDALNAASDSSPRASDWPISRMHPGQRARVVGRRRRRWQSRFRRAWLSSSGRVRVAPWRSGGCPRVRP